MGDFFVGIIRSLFLMIDGVIYWTVNVVYQLFIMLAETGIFTQENLNEFAGRIYALLGVFMLFKVSFSLITYVLNPDDMADKSKGLGKLIQNFFVVLIGIVAVPYIFQAAYSLQSIVLKENIIGSLIMGMNAEAVKDGSADKYVEEGGQKMAFTTLSAFIRLNPDVVGSSCADNPIERINGNVTLSQQCASLSTVFNVVASNGQTVGELVKNAYYHNNINYYTKTDIVNLKAATINGNSEDWIFDYTIVISSVAGGFLVWILLLFCIDVATRSVKLAFLQLVAPIPIISYIDPKSGKDGIFKKWLNQCTKTYLDLFVRLIAIYFVLFVITLVIDGSIHNVTTGDPQTNIFVIVFIIFGALMFAKQLPQLISDILGVKFDGGFTLNPLKKLGQSPYAAGAAGLIGGGLGGMAANAWTTKGNWKGKGFKNGLQNVGSILAGGGSAGFRGAKAGLTSGGKGSLFAGAATGIKASSSARNLRDKGYGIDDKFWDKAQDLAGVKRSTGTTSELKNRTNLLQQQLANSRRNEQAMSTALNQRISESGNMISGLLKTFDGAMQIGADGKPEYIKKTYEAYLETVAKMHASSSGVDWTTLDDSARNSIKTNVVTIGKAATEADFNSFNELYEARNNEDLSGKRLEKQINDIQDDMNKFKDRKKN